MNDRRTDRDGRVLVYAPVGRDAGLTADVLARAAIDVSVCPTVDALRAALLEEAAVVVLTQEVLEEPGFKRLADLLAEQPPWSDIPVLVFADAAERDGPARAIELLEMLPNITLLERPIRITVLVSIVRAALRARSRQYEMRDVLMALRASREQAEAASRLKDEFLATLSHELRTPLNAILGWTAMLRHGQLDAARAARALEVVDRNARAQAQLVEDVLDMSRIITGKLRVNMQPVSLEAVLEAAVESVRPAAEGRGIRLVFDRRTRGADVRGDADRLQQVFWNLLSNAVKFTGEGGEVRVTLMSSQTQLIAEVTDTGAGLAPEFLPYVFDRFRQADQSVTRGHGGLGLGLAIVKHLVELHGGTVEASSEGRNKGATFRVRLPVPGLLSTPDRAAGEDDAAFTLRFPDRRVLVVDDDAATRELLREMFVRAGAQVRTASSAAAAFEEMSREAPDLLVADIGMPDEDGNALMRRVRSLPGPAGSVPALALSAYTRAQDRATATASGFTEFLGKPALPQDVLRTAGRLLEKRKK